MSASTLRQVEGFVQVESLGPVQAKGISRPVEAYDFSVPRLRARASRLGLVVG